MDISVVVSGDSSNETVACQLFQTSKSSKNIQCVIFFCIEVNSLIFSSFKGAGQEIKLLEAIYLYCLSSVLSKKGSAIFVSCVIHELPLSGISKCQMPKQADLNIKERGILSLLKETATCDKPSTGQRKEETMFLIL